MATLKQIQFKRSKTAGARPAASVLAEGELAINLKDRTIFTKDDSGNIIDLSISAGGNISGNITQTGDYLQNGTYNLNGNQFVYAGKYIEFLPKTAGNGAWANQHTNKAPIFTDLSSATSTSEYHPLIKQRYKNGTFSAGTLVNEGSFKIHYIDESGTSKYWTFRRDGGFVVDSGGLSVNGGSISTSGNVAASGFLSAPQVNSKNIILDSKNFGQYDIQSLVQYVYPGTGEENGINYLRKVRAKSGGTIYHEIASAQTGKSDEISWWTGNTLTTKLMGLRNDGAMVLRRSLAIGTITADENTNNYGAPTPMGERYIALGDAATGLKYIKQGVYDLVGNWNSVASITPDSFRSTRKGLFGRSEDQGTTWIMPGLNAAFLSVQTQADTNTAGDGQTHIGYNSGGKMSHYLRGKGQTNINTQEGMEINPGILKLVTGSNNMSFTADGTINSVQRITPQNGLYFSADRNNNGISFKASSSIDGTKVINWDAGTRAGQNKHQVSIKAWGNAFNTSAGVRETVFEAADSIGYHFYSERRAPLAGETNGRIKFQIAGDLLTNGSVTTAGEIQSTADISLRSVGPNYSTIFRTSATNFHILITNKNDLYGGYNSLRPFTVNLETGKITVANGFVGNGGNTFDAITVSGATSLNTVTTRGRLDINANGPAITINCATQADQIYIKAEKAGVQKWWLGCNYDTDIANFFSYSYNHGIALTSGTVNITKPLKVGNIQVGTDGNITGGSGNFANLNTTLNRKVNSGFITYGSTAGWYKFATVTMPQSTSTVSITVTGGNGFNSGSFNQCAISEIVLRTGNNNPKGLNAVLYRRGLNSFRDIAYVNTSGDTYDIYVNMGTYANQLIFNYSSVDNATVQIIGAFSSAQSPVNALPETNVKGQVADVLTNLVDSGKTKRFVAESEIAINNQTGLRITSNGDKSGSNSVLFRNDGSSFYILLTDKNAADGNTTATEGDWNGKRPFSIDMTAGTVRLGENTSFSKDVTIDGSINSRVKVVGQWNVGFADISDVTRDRSAFLANTGAISNTSQSYYPLFSGYSFLTNAGYRQSFEFGWLGVSGTWRQGIIRMRGDNASGQQARWTFDMDGTFYAPILSCGSARAFGVNTSNALGGNSITFGDNDTGIKQNGDGLLDIYANGVQTFRFQNGDLYSYKNINAPNVYIRSDIRLKSNFKPIENALDKVEKLNGVIYDKAEYIGGEAIETEAGIVAQTLQDVLPEAVRETEDSKGNKILTVSSQAQIALLVEAVKTLSSRVKELESKLM